MRPLLVGARALEALSGSGEGRVLTSTRKACYVLFPRGLAVLVAPEVHPGPLHLVLDAPPPTPPPGAPARISDGWLLMGDEGIPMAGTRVWRGWLPSPERFGEVAGVVSQVTADAAGRSLVPRDGNFRDRCHHRLAAGDLEGLAALLAGRGPGFTPAGDDALSGMLVAVRAAWGAAAEPRLLSIARAATTGIVGGSSLAAAARGQGLAPLHDLLRAASEGDHAGARAAARALAAVGASSGADTALGMHWGAGMVLEHGAPLARASF